MNCKKKMEEKETTFAQEVIRKRINEKSDMSISFQDYTEHTDYEAYVDYSESSHCCEYD